MGMTKPGNTIAAIVVAAAPVPPLGSIIGAQLNHPEWTGSAGIGMSMPSGSEKGIYPTGKILCSNGCMGAGNN